MRSLFAGLLLVVGIAIATEPSTVSAPREAKPAVVPAEHPPGTCVGCHQDPHQPAVDAASPRSCETCHAPEGWTPTFTVEAHARTAFPLAGEHQDVACDSCHTGNRLTGLPQDCAGCHIDRHRGKLGGECASCHSVTGFAPVEGFDHDKTGFHVDGAHAAVACADCHRGANGDAMRLVATATCATCHTSEHASFEARACSDCHQTDHTAFADGAFDHRATGWPLERRHKVQDCAACHPIDQVHAPSGRCMDCHADPHSRQLGTRCEDCHRPDRWNLSRFDHDLTGWALRGRHAVTPCATCHTAQRWVGLTTACWDCHAMDAAAAPAQVDAHRWIRSDCGDCHNGWTWR